VRALRWVAAAQLATQATLGVVGFAWFADAMFPHVSPVAALAFRLAAWTNLAAVGLGVWLLRRGDDDGVRAAAAAAATYHTLAAIEGLRAGFITPVPELVEVSTGALPMHLGWVLALVITGLRARPR
jgi:hypothetical protein